jgi:hypothetical protein
MHPEADGRDHVLSNTEVCHRIFVGESPLLLKKIIALLQPEWAAMEGLVSGEIEGLSHDEIAVGENAVKLKLESARIKAALYSH